MPGAFSAARQVIFRSPPELVSIRRVDEAVVIGAALSLSSSAFVRKILQVPDTCFRVNANFYLHGANK